MIDTKRDSEASSAPDPRPDPGHIHDFGRVGERCTCGWTLTEFLAATETPPPQRDEPRPLRSNVLQPWPETAPLRDMLAAAALTGIIACSPQDGSSTATNERIARGAYDMADAMLREREQKQGATETTRNSSGQRVTVTSRYLPGAEPLVPWCPKCSTTHPESAGCAPAAAFQTVTGTVTTPPPIAPPCTRSHRCGWEGPCNGTPRFPLCDEARGYKGAVILHSFHVNEPRCQCGLITKRDRTADPR